MEGIVAIVGKVIGGIAMVGFLVCWSICVVNMIRLIRLQNVFGNLWKNPLRMFSISDALEGEAFGEAGRGPRKWAVLGFVGTAICWAIGFGVLMATQK